MPTYILYDNLPSLHTPSLTENHPFTGRPLTEQIWYLFTYSLNNFFLSSNEVPCPELTLWFRIEEKQAWDTFLGSPLFSWTHAFCLLFFWTLRVLTRLATREQHCPVSCLFSLSLRVYCHFHSNNLATIENKKEKKQKESKQTPGMSFACLGWFSTGHTLMKSST